MRTLPILAVLLILGVACRSAGDAERANASVPPAVPRQPLKVGAGKPVENLPGERFFRSVRQLTFGGENAEAYFSNDGSKLIWQSKRPPFDCDQIFVLDLETGAERLVSTGKGRTTCAYFLQGDRKILYASTHLADERCPPPVMRIGSKYVWPVYAGYDVFTANADGSGLQRLTTTPGYDAEATVCPVTGRIVFTSVRDGDLELYSMEADGSDVQRLTNRVGYDGGAFFSHDGQKIVARSGFFANDDERREYQELLAKGVVQPTRMELVVMRRDGKDFRPITRNGKANFAPYWHPDNKRIIFASNVADPRGRDFELYLVDADGGEFVRVTQHEQFDGFPMFSPDGKWLVFASNRFGRTQGETNIFLAEWVEG
jgi:Tol biopolymer transport system component